MTDQQRKEFEEWMRSADWDLKTPTEREAQLCLWVWQAARVESDKVIEKLVEALETAGRFYAKKSRPPLPEYLVKALLTASQYRGK